MTIGERAHASGRRAAEARATKASVRSPAPSPQVAATLDQQGIVNLPAASRKRVLPLFKRNPIVSKRIRLTILSAVVLVVVGGVAFFATRDSTASREQGLVGPKGPPPNNVRR